MLKNKISLFTFSLVLLIIVSNFLFARNVFANSPEITFSTSTDQVFTIYNLGMIKVGINDPSNENKATETVYLNLLTSGQGEFYSSDTSVEKFVTLAEDFSTSSVYISSGKTSRTFYYKALADGQHKITVLAKSRSGIIFEKAEQIINIGVTSSNTCSSFTYSTWGICSNSSQTRTVLTSSPTDCTGGLPVVTQTCNTNSVSTSSENQATKVVNRVVYVSAHSGEEDLSNYNEKTTFEATAGRERMALVGSPIEFDAKYSLLQKDQCTPIFRWSFGDGFESIDKKVDHTYKYPGEYQIVLNGTCGDYSSISRTKTTVMSPSVSISSVSDDSVEIKNNGKTEINIGNWKINGGSKDFIFSRDTIISPNNKIVLSKEDVDVNASTTKISLYNPSGREVTYLIIENITEQNPIALKTKTDESFLSATSTQMSVADAEILLKKYKERIYLEQEFGKSKPTKIDDEERANSVVGIVQTASVMNSAVSSSTKGFWSKLIDIPSNTVKTIAHMFYDF